MNLCGRTGAWDNAREKAMKDSGIKSSKPGSSMESEQSEQQIGYANPTIIIVITIALLLLFLILIRSKRKR